MSDEDLARHVLESDSFWRPNHLRMWPYSYTVTDERGAFMFQVIAPALDCAEGAD